MSEARFDVLGIGSAIVDILSRCEEDLLSRFDLVKGCMALTSAEKAAQIYGAMGKALEISGGSAANTMAGIASLGGTPAFIGKLGNDKLGEIFRHLEDTTRAMEAEMVARRPQVKRHFDAFRAAVGG